MQLISTTLLTLNLSLSLRISALFFISIFWLAGKQEIHAQDSENNQTAANWYFGKNFGLSFADGQVVELFDSQMEVQEGSATWSDPASGELILYTDGFRVWDRTHQLMPGSDLPGQGGISYRIASTSSTQAALILPHPGDPDLLFVFNAGNNSNNLNIRWPQFHIDAFENFSYQVISLSARGGLGDVIEQRILRPDIKLVEKITGVFQSCSGEFQIVCMAVGKRTTLYVWTLDANGVAEDPVVSDFGVIGLTHEVGEMKFSPDGRRLVEVSRTPNDSPLRIFEFDPTTKTFRDPLLVATEWGFISSSYSVSFSPDNRSIYTVGGGGGIIQYSLDDFTPEGILASRYQYENPERFSYGALQLGPDGMLYIFHLTNTISRIATPNQFGPANRIEQDVISLRSEGQFNAIGLPNFLDQMVLGQSMENTDAKLTAGSSAALVCRGATVRLEASGADAFRWEPAELFTDNTLANPEVRIDETTTFTLIGQLGTCELRTSITVEARDDVNLIVPDDARVCQGQTLQLVASGAETYRWEPAELFADNSLAEQEIVASETIEISVTGVAAGGCQATKTFTIEVVEQFQLTTNQDQSICAGESVSLFVRGADTYRWEPAELFTDNTLPNQELSLTQNTVFTVTGFRGDCEVTRNVFVEVRRPLELTITADTTICAGQSLELFVNGAADYEWELNNTLVGRNSANPKVSPSERTLYRVRGTSDAGCPAFAEVWVDVREALPEAILFALPDTAAQPGERLRLPIIMDMNSATLPRDLPPIRLTIKSEAALLGFEGLDDALLVDRGVENGQQIIQIELPAQRISSKVDSVAFVEFLVYLNADVETPLIIEDVLFLPGPSGPCNPQAVTRSGRFMPHEYCLNYTIVWRKILRVSATPNPASTEFTLFIQPAEGAADARIVVFDQNGAIFQDQRVNTPNADPLELQFDSSAWPIGVYIIRVQSSRTARSVRIQIVR